MVLAQFSQEVLHDFPGHHWREGDLLALSLEDGLIGLPGFLRHVQEAVGVVGLETVELVAQTQFVVQSLDLGVEVSVLELGWVGTGVPSISWQAGQSLSANRAALVGS